VCLAAQAILARIHTVSFFVSDGSISLSKEMEERTIRGSAPKTPWNDTFVAGFAACFAAGATAHAATDMPAGNKTGAVRADSREGAAQSARQQNTPKRGTITDAPT